MISEKQSLLHPLVKGTLVVLAGMIALNMLLILSGRVVLVDSAVVRATSIDDEWTYMECTYFTGKTFRTEEINLDDPESESLDCPFVTKRM
ncbi:hypothetical protein [Sphingorhabdus sp. Alg231-15]|uniref:hypothetical protein n=1 Tax=Sphingorhabdus sp. Alg231-15 TaxID=1922222 RepID=UPI000D55A22D